MNQSEKTTTFELQILGRTLEHLGSQMYKRRNAAIAELVANSWDAGAHKVYITVPIESEYNKTTDSIVIEDDGSGMDRNAIQDAYLVIGRNQREENAGVAHNRLVMGRKGIGKLAGFGMAKKMHVATWLEGTAHNFVLNSEILKSSDNSVKKAEIVASVTSTPGDVKNANGTRITLSELKHNNPIDIEQMHQSLARRFSRTVKGEMEIFINEEPLRAFKFDLDYSKPADLNDYFEEMLTDGNKVEVRYAFSKKPIGSTEQRGFTIYVRGKTAQAPNFFFDVEGKVSGQHATKYLTGEIIADYLDDGIDGESDIVSTDRQEIDWENETVTPLKEWGGAFIKKLFKEWLEHRGGGFEENLLETYPDLNKRITVLDGDKVTGRKIRNLIKVLGQAESDPERTYDLADGLIKAYEYRNFYDVVSKIEEFENNPDGLSLMLEYLSQWKVLESRAILEIVKGRLQIIQKFHTMSVNDFSETANPKGTSNMHDLLASYPWILNPDWQVLREETAITTQLKDWNVEDIEEPTNRERYDFLGLSDERRLVVIEIKRAGHPLELEELQRLERYKERLGKGSEKEIGMVLIYGGTQNMSPTTWGKWTERDDLQILKWGEVYEKSKRHYQHYQAILEGKIDDPSFAAKQQEIFKTRDVVATGEVYRTTEERKDGLGPQDVDYQS
ncbi:MAG: ATP-binding protein [Flavobacteriales bacterium]|nr:ATP-binding protein [Flavobacteriales bacterium]